MTETVVKLKQVCEGCKARMDALSLKGRKRDEATLHYFCGAALFAPELTTWVALILSTRGYQVVEEELRK